MNRHNFIVDRVSGKGTRLIDFERVALTYTIPFNISVVSMLFRYYRWYQLGRLWKVETGDTVSKSTHWSLIENSEIATNLRKSPEMVISFYVSKSCTLYIVNIAIHLNRGLYQLHPCSLICSFL